MTTENAFEVHKLPAEMTIPCSENAAKQILDFTDACMTCVELPLKKANRLRIAVDEICTNIVSYSGAAKIRCVFAVKDGEIQFSICDDGVPYNPLTQDTPDVTATAEERPFGGLGILLVKRLMDRVEYQYSAAQNILTLYMKLD